MNSTILIFSDTHLTHQSDARKLRFLMRIINKADHVIINGDFWDGDLTSAEQFAKAPFWQPLFRLLRDKKAIYLYGNHDTVCACNGIEDTFSMTHQQTFDFEQNGQAFHCEHGNAMNQSMERMLKYLPRPIMGFFSLTDSILTRILGRRYLALYSVTNNRMKNWQKNHIDNGTYMICGDSHLAELSPHQRYANSGSIRGGIGSYLLIRDGKIELRKERY